MERLDEGGCWWGGWLWERQCRSVDSEEVEHAVRMIMWVGLWREEMRSLIE